jgi:hypothetical protein
VEANRHVCIEVNAEKTESVVMSHNENVEQNYNLLIVNKSFKNVAEFSFLYGCETWSLTLTEELILKVFENRVLRRIFGSKREEVAGGWRTLHNEELHNLYTSPNVIVVIKSKRMRCVGRGTRMRDVRNEYKILIRKSEWESPPGRLVDFTWLRIGTNSGSCENRNGNSGSVKGGEFLDQLNDFWFLSKSSAPLSRSVSQSVIHSGK